MTESPRSFVTSAVFGLLLVAASVYFLTSPLWSAVSLIAGGAGFGIYFFFHSQHLLRNSLGRRSERFASERYLQDITHRDTSAHAHRKLIGRKEEEEAAQILLSRFPLANLLIIGDPGSGKKTFLHGLLSRDRDRARSDIARVDRRYLILDLKRLAADGRGTHMEKEGFLRALFDDVLASGKAVIIATHADEFLGKNSSLDLSRFFSEYASHPDLSLLMTMRSDRYHQLVQENRVLEHFEALFLREPKREEAKEILRDHFLPLHAKRIIFTEDGLEQLWSSARILPGQALPHEKAIEIGEEIVLSHLESPNGAGHFQVTSLVVEDFLKKRSPFSKKNITRGMSQQSFRQDGFFPKIGIDLTLEEKNL